MSLAVEVRGLAKSYGKVRVLKEIDLEIPAGTVLGLLGPNGAGKTTTVRVVTTLLRPDAGSIRVAGVDVLADPATARTRIGLSGQYAAVDANLTGYENLRMVARLYGMSRKQAVERAEQLLAALGLEYAAGRRAGTYSGGMARRLDLAGALVARPPVVVLDEPTTGLDPRGRLDMWQVIGDLVDDGTTVLLTTQYLEEADLLADRITVIDKGTVIARGSADELKTSIGGDRLTVTLAAGQSPASAMTVLQQVGVGEPIHEPGSDEVSVVVGNGSRTMVEALRRLDDAGVCVVDAVVVRPTLDDVFLSLTGTPAEPVVEPETDDVQEEILS
ncbi:daunorubicin resistance protein DrrA family ABC transporter ATP-binding protein [Nocardia asteroides]|uniref:ABC transporter ATP-binding protein n=1 Tax=Nocardia asteroides NBRC 15531 TaxID=1110697 RepID=U5EHH8_NOCAS|nr:daunorubicin resistance protein DrrA family ABC transporter ATP-binding protein [Nocardia asteroides]TLF67407.1 daunorubicin resistance protein DrrA family ABC transporter ATP-binding protein [Nocardia asteroides NBRC 15531]UGT51108.1 daunorubicin resistance protein DrrA family ABC transporter ATP-binding protein [Nocardia asteroides]SFM35211.1 ABC-2 type transport system ATP-binding protein [Nocardia asteroides]VEG36024.1 Daunorubicin/doxorubicin resistance ATP-binding protein DrrA [Nocardi